MNIIDGTCFEFEGDGLSLRAAAVPWDSEVFGRPVAAISHIDLKAEGSPSVDFEKFRAWVHAQGFELVSCRLPHSRLDISMLLEQHGFKFIEMVLHPVLRQIGQYPVAQTGLQVEAATDSDLPTLIDISHRAFGFERYHADPRIDSRLADARYGRWVRNSIGHARQRLLKICEGERIVGMFVVEQGQDRLAYWHLTAVHPDCHGQGLGNRVWMAMIGHHQAQGIDCIRTTIAARNSRVLNLYAKLDFRFDEPEMTFHWLEAAAS